MEKACTYIQEHLLKLFIQREYVAHSLSKALINLCQPLLFVVGFALITGGIKELSYGYDPEPMQAQDEPPLQAQDESPLQAQDEPGLQAQDPENVCCIDAYPEQGFTAPFAEQTITFNAEGAITQNAETSISFNAEGAVISDQDLLNGPALDPEAISPEDPEPLEPNYDDRLSRNATGNLLRFIEGSFGALVMVASGIGAIVAAAFGAYKAAIALLFVAVGSFILRALVSLFFGTNYPAYDVQFVGGNGV